MSIQDFKFYNHSISQVLANDQKAHLSLRKIASAVKSDRKIFRTLAEPLIDGQILIPILAKHFRHQDIFFTRGNWNLGSTLYFVVH